jgi:ferrochelatase
MAKRALLIVNLGSPDSPKVKDVKRYLGQFLMDRDVIDMPFPLRLILVKGLIVPFRAKNSAHAYTKIFTPRGSPLKFLTEDFTHALKEELHGEFHRVEYAMRYAHPSIAEKLEELANDGIRELVVAPMYPQFAKSSTRTVLSEVARVIRKNRITALKAVTIRDFFHEPCYYESFSQALQEEVKTFRPDHLLLSYHGLPESQVKEFAPAHCFTTPECCAALSKENRLCYRAQCFESSRLIMKSVPDLKHTVSFQSRLGRKEWIKPYTDLEIHQLRAQGVKRLLVACPAFVADCLETLEEIALRLKDDFLRAGGEDLKLVPSLNARPYWVKSFAGFLKSTSFEDLERVLQELK